MNRLSIDKSMYKGKSIKSMNDAQYNKVRQMLLKNGVDLNNRPDPYALIREEEKERNIKKSNIPYNWINNRMGVSSNESSFEDPNASVTISRA